jgi:hypothetical protein
MTSSGRRAKWDGSPFGDVALDLLEDLVKGEFGGIAVRDRRGANRGGCRSRSPWGELRLDKDLPKQPANFVVRPFRSVTEISHIVSILARLRN